jgi:hypothetical protein
MHNEGYLGICKSNYSQYYKEIPVVDFLSNEKNLLIGAWLFAFYPEDMTADILFIVTQADFCRTTDIFLKSLFYGDTFSCVYSSHGILEDCTIEKFEIIATRGIYLNVRALIKVKNFIPSSNDEIDSEIIKKINLEEIEKRMSKSTIDIKECKISYLSVIGIGDLDKCKRKIVIAPSGKNRYDKDAILSVYFELPKTPDEDKVKNIEMIKNNINFNDDNVAREYVGWNKKGNVIPQRSYVKLFCGEQYNFLFNNPKIHDVTYVIKSNNEKDVEKDEQQYKSIYCVKIKGDIEYNYEKNKRSVTIRKV